MLYSISISGISEATMTPMRAEFRIVERIGRTMATTMSQQLEIPHRMVNLSDLHFDIHNPRRTSTQIELDQRSLLIELYQLYDINDLLVSFSVNGYFSEEPLIAIPSERHSPDPHAYIVVEGNRRLAALKILMCDEFSDIVPARSIPAVSPEVRTSLDPVPVKIYETRSQVLPYLGVRHIAGTKPWEALAKARYVANLVEAGESYIDVARRVGSGRRTDVVRKWLLTLYSIDQANGDSDIPWDIENQKFGFSWLFTSIGYRSIRDYLGLSGERFENPSRKPVPDGYVDKLIHHMTDLYGPAPGNSREAVVKESRQISDLAKVYADGEALSMLRAGATLTYALEKTIDEKGQLIELLRRAELHLGSAISIAPNHKEDEEALRLAQRCYNTASALKTTLST